jgi:hypothetical protein
LETFHGILHDDRSGSVCEMRRRVAHATRGPPCELTEKEVFDAILHMAERRSFSELQASELWCPRCKAARPVREHLLLVLPTGNKYEYRCAACETPVGARDDGDGSEFRTILRRR